MDKKDQCDVLVQELAKVSEEIAQLQTQGRPFISQYQNLEKCITKLRAAQGYKPKNNSAVSETKRDMKPLFQWLKQQDFPAIENFDVTFSPSTGHSLVTKTPLQSETLVLQVPLRLMMTNKTAVESTKVALLLHNDAFLQDIYSLALTLHLLTEKFSKESFWAPYINTLPKVNQSPLYWTLNEVMRFEGSLFFQDLVRYKAIVARQYAHVYKRLVKQLEVAVMKRTSFTWEAFLWAHTTVNSRKNNILVKGKNGPVQSLALIPLFDLMNHEEDLQNISSEYDCDQECLNFYAPRDVQEQQELKMYYGSRSNTDFLLYQGFVPARKNANSYIQLSFKLSEADPAFDQKLELLKQSNLGKEMRFKLFHDHVEENLLTFLRIVWASKEELTRPVASFQRMVSLDNETKVHLILHLKVQQTIKQSNLSIQEIKDRLQSLQLMGDQILLEEQTILSQLHSKLAKKIQNLKDQETKRCGEPVEQLTQSTIVSGIATQ